MITREIRRHDGDIHAGIVAGVGWIAENLPVYSLNLIITTEAEIFALRYPDTNTLYVLERAAGGNDGEQALRHHSSLGTRVHSEEAAQRPPRARGHINDRPARPTGAHAGPEHPQRAEPQLASVSTSSQLAM